MTVYHDSFLAMGTRFDLVLPGVETDLAEAFRYEAEAVVRHLERKLSRFDSESAVFLLNRHAAMGAVSVDDDVVDVLDLSLRFNERTDGAFDITLLPLLDAWKDAAENDGRPLSKARVERIRESTGMHHIDIDRRDRTVRFDEPDLKIDLGGIGKGYALVQVQELLESWRIASAFISFGESAVLARGHHPHGSGWKVGIQHLFRSGVAAHSFLVSDQSVSTSGTTPGNTTRYAPWYGHVISPYTGMPVTGDRSVSVVSASPLDAEVLSTALLVAPRDRRDAICRSFDEVMAVEIEYGDDQEAAASWDFVPTESI